MKNTVLITGGSQRIGKIICQIMAKEGWNIAIHFNKSEKKTKELSNSLRTQYEGFKSSYEEAAKVTEEKGKDHDKDGDVDSKDYMKSKDIAIKKAMAKK